MDAALKIIKTYNTIKKWTDFIVRRTLLLINVVAYILCSKQIQHIKNITSLLNTTDIEIIDENNREVFAVSCKKD